MAATVVVQPGFARVLRWRVSQMPTPAGSSVTLSMPRLWEKGQLKIGEGRGRWRSGEGLSGEVGAVENSRPTV